MFRTKRLFQILSLFMILTMLMSIGQPRSVQASLSEAGLPRSAAQVPVDTPTMDPPPSDKFTDVGNDPMGKIHPDLRDKINTITLQTPSDPIPVEVQVLLRSGETIDLSAFFVDGKSIARNPLGEGDAKMQLILGLVKPLDLYKLAANENIQVVLPIVFEQNGYPLDYPIDEEHQLETRGPEDWDALREQSTSLQSDIPAWQDAKAFGDGRPDIPPLDWFEVKEVGPHKAEAAWERGFKGKGVTVALLDDGIDTAHPDLMGTQKLIDDPDSPYYGWPMVFSPFSALGWAYEVAFATPYISQGYPSMHYVDTSLTPAVDHCGPALLCFKYTPLIDFGVRNPNEYLYVLSAAITRSGVVHVGTHPDNDLRDYVWGEKPAVLVIDPNQPGVYDTVIIDLNDNKDFTDDKWLTRADMTNDATIQATYNNMVSYLDVNKDGLADISGGMVYYVADGVNGVPVFDWLWSSDPAFIPGNGALVAISGGTFDRAYSHGTQCASNIVGQGRTNGLLPTFYDRDTEEPFQSKAAVLGMAPEAKVVNVSDVYFNFASSKLDAYLFSAVGYDGCTQNGKKILDTGIACSDGDAIQVTSNSYGSSDQNNDGWDLDGQVVTQIQNWYAPSLQFLFSTGNGGPGYGTVSPPSSATGIGVGASTEYGSTGWDNIRYMDQITYNDITPFSNRGPSARDGAGIDVVAGGAYAAGAEELNYYTASFWGVYNGNLSWDSWGGASRSTPVATGVLALIYQAYFQANHTWPTYDQARALLMASATDLNYDVYTQGAGSVNADRGTLIASGEYGVFPDLSSWTPGNYRGVDYPSFAKLVEPGKRYSQEVTLTNPSPQSVTVDLSDGAPVKIGSSEFTYSITPEMFVAKSPDNFYKAPQFILPITASDAEKAVNAWWDHIAVPADTELMVVRMRYPFDQFDENGDYTADNRFRLMVYDWMDYNQDGQVWVDQDGNGVVSFETLPEATTIDGGQDLDWVNAEVQQYEYARFGYNRPGGNVLEMWVQDPLHRMHDGLFIGLQQYDASVVEQTDLSFEIDFYQYTDETWVDPSVYSLTVPAGGSASFTITADIPLEMPAGDYEAAVKIIDPGTGSYPAHTIVIPVTINVVADFAELVDGGHLAGIGDQDYAGDDDYLYDNNQVRGYFDWTWREESGDWRFFYTDVQDIHNTVYLLEDFGNVDGVIPIDWTVVDNLLGGSGGWDGISGGWSTTAQSGNVNLTGGWGTAAEAVWKLNPLDTELRTPAMDLAGAVRPMLTFTSDFHTVLGDDEAYVDATTDNGATWKNLLHYDGASVSGPKEVKLDLSPFIGYDNVVIRFHYVIMQFNVNDWKTGWQVDDVTIAEEYQGIVVDRWNDAGMTDIDTEVLGPTLPSWGQANPILGFEKSRFVFGPYVLDTVGRGEMAGAPPVWNYNTSSGGPEDWVAFPLQEGLHEILQHNVLYSGSQAAVEFQKDLGLLHTGPASFDVKTYLPDGGMIGTVKFTSSIDLPNGLVADAYGLGSPEYYAGLNLPFNGTGSPDYTRSILLNHAARLEAWVSSDVDLDLYFYYCGPTGADPCLLKGISATSSNTELATVVKPADGAWIIVVDNYSGPASSFDMSVYAIQGSSLQVTNVPGEVAKDSEVSFDIKFTGPLTPGQTYEGVIYYGPAEAPALIEVPIKVSYLQSAEITKSVNLATAYPGDYLTYQVKTMNSNDDDPRAQFIFKDPIPTNTTFVPGSLASSLPGFFYNPDTKAIEYNGNLPLHYKAPNLEDFELGLVPPPGWRVESRGVVWGAGWGAWTGKHSIRVEPAEGLRADGTIREGWLLSPRLIDLQGGEPVDFWSVTVPGIFCEIIGIPCSQLNTYLVVNGLGGGDDVLLGKAQQENFLGGKFTYNQFTLPDPLPEGDLQIGLQYKGAYLFYQIDAITLPGKLDFEIPSNTLMFQVQVADDQSLVSSTVTNEASLIVRHYRPGVDEVVPAIKASASTHIIGVSPVFGKSTLVAPKRAVRGETFTYKVTLLNKGVETVPVSFTDPIPEGVTYAGTSVPIPEFSFNGAANAVTWTGNLVPGVPKTFLFDVTAALHGPELVTNVAHLNWANGSSLLSAATRVGDAVPEFTTSRLAAPASAPRGDPFQYEVTLVNTGWVSSSVAFSDPLPAGASYLGTDSTDLSYNPGTNTVEWSGSLAVDETAKFKFSVRTNKDAAALITNTASLVWAEGRTGLVANTTILDPDFSKSVQIAPASVMRYDTFIYAFTLLNTGNLAVQAAFSDPLPVGVTYAGTNMSNPPFSYDEINRVVNWNGELTPNVKVTFSFKVTVDPHSPSLITNIARLDWGKNRMDLTTVTMIGKREGTELYMPLIFH